MRKQFAVFLAAFFIILLSANVCAWIYVMEIDSNLLNTAKGGKQLSIVAPSTRQNDDLLIAFVDANDDSAAMVGPTGWIAWQTVTSTGTDLASGIWYKYITNNAGEPTFYTWTCTGARKWSGGIINVRGADSTVIDVNAVTTGINWDDTTDACPTVTTATNNALVFPFAALTTVTGGTLSGFTAPTNTTLLFSLIAIGANTGVAYYIQSPEGATGTKQFITTGEQNTEEWHTYQLAVKPRNIPPVIDITYPEMLEDISSGTYLDINFTITEANCNTKACDLNLDLWYSVARGGMENAINILDLNVLNPVDVNCGNDYNFINGSNCSVRWNISSVPDGIYYIDANAWDFNSSDLDSGGDPFVLNLPPVITVGTHDGNVLHDRNVQFHATCTNAGDNFTIYACKSAPAGDPGFRSCTMGVPVADKNWCASRYTTDTTPDCNYLDKTPCTIQTNQYAYVTCCDDTVVPRCDLTNYKTLTLDVMDELRFTTFSPANSASKKQCELDYFDINGVTKVCAGGIILDVNMEVFAGGLKICDDNVGDIEIPTVSAGYACTATMAIAAYNWHIDINQLSNWRVEGNTTLNREAERTYTVANDQFRYTIWEPPNNATYNQGNTIDFNLTGLLDTCGTTINNATVSFYDNTEAAEICNDTTGSSGLYTCTGTAGTHPLDTAAETIYMEATKANFDNNKSANRTLNLNLIDLTFSMGYPSSGCNDGNGCTGACPGGACTYCNFRSETVDGNAINCAGQTSGTPFYAYDNQGTVQDWTMDLNANITGTGLFHKVSTGSGGYEAVCTDTAPPDTTHCVYVMTTTPVQIAVNIDSAVDANAWAWADFVDIGGSITDRNVTHTSIAS